MEKWRDIVGYEGYYQISSEGRVRGLDRYLQNARGPHFQKGKVRNLQINKDGYKIIMLSKGGVRTTRFVHHLVLEAFVGPRPTPQHCGCHNNGICDDNQVENLRWGTLIENAQDKFLHGTDACGERSTSAKLSCLQVLGIRRDARSRREVAKDYGVAKSTITDIVTRRTWAHI